MVNVKLPRPNSVLALLVAFLALFTASIPPIRADAPGAATLNTIEHTTIPSRDPADLGRRLLGITTPLSTPAAPKAYKLGDVETFSAEDDSGGKTFTIDEQLVYVTPHVYVWFQVGSKPDMNAVKKSTDIFENQIYPTVHDNFGSEASPGIDNDVHVFIVHAHGLGSSIEAYYDSASEYPKQLVPASNEHEMFFVNLDTMQNLVGSPEYLGTLAHEFQHMVRHNTNPTNEEGWMDEGLAELSRSINGYTQVAYSPQFMAAPQTQLDGWAQDQPVIAHYGAAYLWLSYFYQRYGKDAIRKLEVDPDNGLEAFRSTLKAIGATDPQTRKPIMVEDLFADWTMANLLDNVQVEDGRYAHTRIKDQLATPAITDAVVSDTPQTVTTNQWGTAYLRINKPGTYQFKFSGQSSVKVTPTDAHSGSMMWWSNRDDKTDTRLTHKFDLSGVNKATLSFWLWYATEQEWDYGYVEVSTDGGQTWKALATQDSVAGGGHNNPYGPAYTGHSGGGDTPQEAVWRQETADLTPYAGKQIMVRFEMMTDDAYNEQGMLVDDISVQEIKYSTDAEADDGGWTADGWVRMDNVLPQRYLVQMAEYGSVPSSSRVFRLLGPDDGNQGQWTLKVGGDVSQLVIAVSGMTQFTTEAAPFQYTLTAQP